MTKVFYLTRQDLEAMLVQWAETDPEDAARFYAEQTIFPPTLAGLKTRLASVGDLEVATMMSHGFGMRLEPIGDGRFDQIG